MNVMHKPVVQSGFGGNHQASILMADDDPDDLVLACEALRECRFTDVIETVNDGEELLDLLYRRGPHEGRENIALPALILLDLNMPKIDGREALREIKSDPELRKIPIVVLTTSRASEDIDAAYELGANSFIVKPADFGKFVKAMETLVSYWFETNELPSRVD